ncbi:MAG TPA: hypothetical protein RMH99_01360 [Sandaracinaceae bacterium LLY-WYZ-13_1]|nr:hypothetical protein [Sandaracinaceae bacterium LLY-WYZ-13_1]
MHHRRAVSLVVLAAAVLVACGRTTYVRIRHPLQVGQVDPNSVPFEHTREERRRRLPPGTLVDEAQLLVLNPEQICVRVTVWSTDLEPQRSDFRGYRIALLNDRSDLENTSAQIQLEQPRVGQYQGIRRVYRGGYRTTATSHTYTVTQQPAVLCFPNQGFVTPSTTHLTLELEDAGAGNRINFEWDFDSSVAAPPQG